MTGKTGSIALWFVSTRRSLGQKGAYLVGFGRLRETVLRARPMPSVTVFSLEARSQRTTLQTP